MRWSWAAPGAASPGVMRPLVGLALTALLCCSNLFEGAAAAQQTTTSMRPLSSTKTPAALTSTRKVETSKALQKSINEAWKNITCKFLECGRKSSNDTVRHIDFPVHIKQIPLQMSKSKPKARQNSADDMTLPTSPIKRKSCSCSKRHPFESPKSDAEGIVGERPYHVEPVATPGPPPRKGPRRGRMCSCSSRGAIRLPKRKGPSPSLGELMPPNVPSQPGAADAWREPPGSPPKVCSCPCTMVSSPGKGGTDDGYPGESMPPWPGVAGPTLPAEWDHKWPPDPPPSACGAKTNDLAIPVEGSCTAYIQCHYEQATHKDCYPKYFNYADQICDFLENVICQYNQNLPPSVGGNNEDGNAYPGREMKPVLPNLPQPPPVECGNTVPSLKLPIKGDCLSYMLCYPLPQQVKCDPPTRFSYNMQSCEAPEIAGCVDESSHMTQRPERPPQMDDIDEGPPPPPQWVKPHHDAQPPEQWVDPNQRPYQPPQSDNRHEGSPPPQQWVDPNQSPPNEQSVEYKCREGHLADHFVTIWGVCNAFLHCFNNSNTMGSVRQDCPPATEWDHKTGRCDWPHIAGCKERLQREQAAANSPSHGDQPPHATPPPAMAWSPTTSWPDATPLPPTMSRPAGPPTRCEPDLELLIPVPKSCEGFVYCPSGETGECDVGMHFSFDTQTCEVPSRAGCSKREAAWASHREAGSRGLAPEAEDVQRRPISPFNP